MKKIPFNKPHYPFRGFLAIFNAAIRGTISGNGYYTQECQAFFEKRYGFKKALLTTSCSDALEMAALLADIKPGDEVILPSFTFVSTANAFVLRGARLRFADTLKDIPNIDPDEIEKLITPATKAIAVVHYSGIACDMDRIMDIAKKHNLFVIEDAAHAIDSFYKGKPLGSIGHFGTFSFHETKNIFCGEGGMLTINDDRFVKRAEILWEKGTNRAAFHRKEVDHYNWVDAGSSFLPSDALAAFLWVQLKDLEKIQRRRIRVWSEYFRRLQPVGAAQKITVPILPDFATHNGNLFFILMPSREERDKMLEYLKSHGIQAVFHYLPLHSSPYFKNLHDGRPLPNTDRFAGCIVRLPFYYGLKPGQIKR
ncbi:MAG TPA: dTDP-4-amino-4,6-dideoxygalactose transaminase, partial [Bacteroidales bacterium]|nr:dTDP-4-amino-4,6-dideoxygalactose transaminase [Bacteroidales bacterium]